MASTSTNNEGCPKSLRALEKAPASLCTPNRSNEELTHDDVVINQIVDIVSNRFDHGIMPDKNPTFRLLGRQRAFERLLDSLEGHNLRDYFSTLRYEWTAHSGELTLLLISSRMHGVFLSKRDVELTRLLKLQQKSIEKDIAKRRPLTVFMSFIRELKIMRHNHNTQFYYKDAKKPALVYDVVKSQSGTGDLLKLSQTYPDRWPEQFDCW